MEERVSQDTPDLIAERLRGESVVDLNGLLKPGGRAEIVAAVERWKERGLKAHVVLARGAHPSELGAIWDALHADPKEDLLLIFDTRDWAARGWGLPEERIRATLAAAEPGLHQYFGRGITNALEGLGQAATGVAAPKAVVDERSTHIAEVVGGSIGALLLVGALGFVVRRRNRRTDEKRAVFDAARGSAEKAYAELMLLADELPGRESSELQLKGAEIKRRLDALADEAAGSPSRMDDPVTLGRIRQFENELATLRSTSLQQARRS
jgi:hypothetical protein